MKGRGRWILLALLAAGGLYLLTGRSTSADAAAEASPTAPRVSFGRVRVEVLNAGGVAGMAREATGHVRAAGFDVVSFGNARSFDPDRPSVVIDRVGRLDVARAVADALGIGNVLSEPDSNLFVDVSVLLGSTWTPESVRSTSEDESDRPWWDPRER